MEFNFIKLIFSLDLQSDVGDNCLLFELRKVFAEAFRRSTGCERPQCEKCDSAEDCPYWQIFAQEVGSDPSAIKRFQKPPLPFAFDLPRLPPPPNRGRTVEVGLVLAGRAVNHLLHFIGSVEAILGPRGGFSDGFGKVARIESLDYLGNRTIIARDGGKKSLDQLFVLSLDGVEKSAILPAESATITFEVPLRLIRDGRPVRELAFQSLAMSLIRRMSSMAHHYCFMDLDLEYGWLSRLSAEIMIEDNDFRWVEWGRNLGGIVGRGTFTGNLVEFHPFLLFGGYFHAGKGAAYGLGRYRLDNDG